jgi:hypothetical protein
MQTHKRHCGPAGWTFNNTYGELSDVRIFRDDSVRCLVPDDAVILSAGLTSNDVFNESHDCTPGHLQVATIDYEDSYHLHLSYEADDVRIDWVADPTDPEIWRAIESWKKHGTVFLTFVDEYQDHLVKIPYIAADWDIPQGKPQSYHFSDQKILDGFLDVDLGATNHARLKFVYRDAPRFSRYFSINALHTATLDRYFEFSESLTTSPPMNVAVALKLRGTATNRCLQDIRMKAEQTSRGYLVYPQQLPDEISARFEEPFCLCVALSTIRENCNDIFLSDWVDVHDGYHCEHRKWETTMYINRVQIDFDDDFVTIFRSGTGERFPVLFLGEHGWNLMIYRWNQEMMSAPVSDESYWMS